MTRTGKWWNQSWNPTSGCTKVSQACKHCYAERDWNRLQHLPAYAGRTFSHVACHPERLNMPLHWKRPRRVFVDSMSDLFHESVPDAFIDQVFAIMAMSPRHTFLIVTKRAKRMYEYMSAGGRAAEIFHLVRDGLMGHPDIVRKLPPLSWPLRNVHLGVTAEDQETAEARAPYLLLTPAAVRFVSVEPMLGPIDFTRLRAPLGFDAAYLNAFGFREDDGDVGQIDGVICGGESGPHARPMHPVWVRALRDQCDDNGVYFLYKQWGEWVPRSACFHTFEDGRSCADHDPEATKWPCIRLNENGKDGRFIESEDGGESAYMQRTGKKFAGRLLDGVLHNDYPARRH